MAEEDWGNSNVGRDWADLITGATSRFSLSAAARIFSESDVIWQPFLLAFQTSTPISPLTTSHDRIPDMIVGDTAA